MRKDDLQCFCKMFVVFYTVHLYMCIYDLFLLSNDTLMDSRNVCIHVFMLVYIINICGIVIELTLVC